MIVAHGGGEPEKHGRMLLVAGAVLGVLALSAVRVGQLSIVEHYELSALARRQHRERVRIVAPRGGIVDRNGEVLAQTVGAPSIFASPKRYPIPAEIRPALGQAIGISLRVINRRLDSKAGFVWLKRHATQAQAETVMRLRLPGVESIDEGRRFYPQGMIGAHVVGVAGADLRGLEGIELEYDAWMRGQETVYEVERDGRGRAVFTAGMRGDADPSEDATVPADAPARTQLAAGASLELTIDAGLQAMVERELANGVREAQADAGTAIMLDPTSGAILALANVPSYNPNQPGVGDPAARRNRAVTDRFEPGSTFKAILTAAALEEHVITPDDRFFCENGRYQIGRWTIHDHAPYGLLSVPEVIQYSSNIGASKIGQKLGRELFAKYVTRFGFGRPTSIDLPAEASGVVRPAESWAAIDLATHSFGQGISVTPIQLASAYGALAAGGELHQPYLVARAIDPHGRVLFERDGTRNETATRQVVGPQTARTVTAMLERVVEMPGGTGEKARIDGFEVAGKTGTAQKAAVNGHGYSKERLASFVGFAPAERPTLLTLVMIDNPRTSPYGGTVAAPVFAAITSRALDRLGIEPNRLESAGASPAADGVRPAVRQISSSGSELPSFIGMSLRAAVDAARRDGITIEARGSGRVVAQSPAAGSARASSGGVVLTLEPPT